MKHIRKSHLVLLRDSLFRGQTCLLFPRPGHEMPKRLVSSFNWKEVGGGATVSSPLESERPSSVDEKEMNFFRQFSDRWWKNSGEFRALQTMNEIRVPFISNAYITYASGLRGHTIEQQGRQNSSLPLKGVKVLDVGCGGGLLSEPLARLGGNVTGIDMVEESIRVAKLHWKKSRGNAQGSIEYVHGTVEELAKTDGGKFDVVVCSEVLEHVKNVPDFVQSLAELTRPGGVVICSTINRTAVSFFAAIFLAEYVFKIIPQKTHFFSKFLTPEELESFLRKNQFFLRMKHGACYNPLTQRWAWSSFDGVNYFLAAVKASS